MSGNYNYSYDVRQPTTRRSSVRKKPFESNQQVNIMPDNNDFLCHFGIPGMKWGVRRFQNDDGTLTEEGKQRYGRDSEPESKSWKKSDASNLSDDELRRRNNRLQSERQYRDLTTTQAERDRAQMRNEIKKDFIKKAVLIPIGAVLAAGGTLLIKKNGTRIIDMLEHFAKKKFAAIKASNILKNTLKKSNVPNAGQYNPLKDYALGKHPEWKDLDLFRLAR